MAMEIEHERPPAYIDSHPDRIVWPSIPQHTPLHHHAPSDITLPDLKTVLSSEFERQLSPTPSLRSIQQHHSQPQQQQYQYQLQYSNPQQQQQQQPRPFHHHQHHRSHGSPISVRSLPPIDLGYGLHSDPPRPHDAGFASPLDTSSVRSSDDHGKRSTSVVSMDDPDVRIAAEALSGLGNPGVKTPASHTAATLPRPLLGGGFASSPRAPSLHPPPQATPDAQARAQGVPTEQEPLLELISQAHPWVGGTIKGSLSAYSTTKNYSPRIVQYGANLVERNITIPVVSAVSSVGELTGVEGNLRRYLDARRPNELDPVQGSEGSNKRKALLEAPADVEGAYIDPSKPVSDLRRDSAESRTEPLPRYGASRPPSYREEDPVLSERATSLSRPPNNRSWSSHIFVTTSGLSVALSTTSRRSLRYCLSLLGQSADQVSHLTTALSLILKEYERARATVPDTTSSALEKGERPPTPDQNESARHLAEAIKKHSDDIWHVLRYVVDSVSNYAGGALPENARQFVRQQLMSLPQRWRVVSDGQSGESETSRSAQRMIDFAREGLDMMTQVSGVLKATLESAEKWLERVGRRDRQHDEEDQIMADAPWQQPVTYDEKS